MKEFGITYLNGRDASGKIAVDYGVWGIPETFFVDAQGRITYKHAGELKTPTITSKLDAALRGIVSAEQGKSEYPSVRLNIGNVIQTNNASELYLSRVIREV